MNRLTLFAKGNLDLRDTLHSLRLGGKLVWNGVGEIVRGRHPDWTVRVRHETWTRSDALLAATGAVPSALAGRAVPLAAYPAASQFSTAVFETDTDAILLSIQPDLTISLVRNRRDNYLFLPTGWQTWPKADQDWIRANFASSPSLDVGASMANFARIVERIRANTAAPILIYNVSAAVPGEQIHSHLGMEDAFSTRIRQFNLGLIELSQNTGISVIDVDSILARGGADRLKLDALHFTAEGCRLVAGEVVRVLEDLGLFQAVEARR
ncbi:MAG TPA: SGNH/GDSL hydrolase family protein [Caulobacteraceae bacterium]|nr:SGNH/GDSL hydrolase family protein [Caulobacteraceae bacterium]